MGEGAVASGAYGRDEMPCELTARLVNTIAATQFEAFDSATVAYAKTRIVDTVGAMLAGVRSPHGRMVLDVVKTWGGRPESVIVGTGVRVPAESAALAMGVMARANDFEPAGGATILGHKSPGHYSATSVPVAFAVAVSLGLGGRELITALVLGDDLACRIGAAGEGDWNLGWDPAGTCSRFGAAAIAGKLMGLNPVELANALGISLNMISGTMLAVSEYTHSFLLNQGVAGWNGILSARLAARGFTGPVNFLTGRYGYFDQFCTGFEPQVIFHQLGQIFYADEEFKLFPCCRGNHAAIEAALALAREESFDYGTIREIRVRVPPRLKDSFLAQAFRVRGALEPAAMLNLSYNVASALVRKDVKLEYYTPEGVIEPAVQEMIKKVAISCTWTDSTAGAEVSVVMADGRVLTRVVDCARGDYRLTALSSGEIERKFLDNVEHSHALTPRKAAAAYKLLMELETQDSLEGVVRALTP